MYELLTLFKVDTSYLGKHGFQVVKPRVFALKSSYKKCLREE